MKKSELYDLVILALFISIELMMNIAGFGMVPVGPLKMSFLMIPVATGAILLGPWQGALLGAVFGLCSLWDAHTGSSVLTGFFYHNVSKLHTVVLCVGTRTVMGLLVGWIFRGLQRIEKQVLPYYGAALSAALMNTILFMGYMMLVFFKTEVIQDKAAELGTANPLLLIVLMVGVQGLVEMIACTFVGGTVSKAVASAIKKS